MHIKYAISDFIFIILHKPHATPILISVTTRKRVGRTMAMGELNEEKMMNTNLSGGSARIYQFPEGGRAALGGHRYLENRPATDLVTALRLTEAACAGSWYHEAAILESKPVREG